MNLAPAFSAQTELERAVRAGVPTNKVRHLRAHALLLQRKYGEAQDLLDPRTIPPQFAAYAARLRGRILAQQSKLPEARAKRARHGAAIPTRWSTSRASTPPTASPTRHSRSPTRCSRRSRPIPRRCL